MNASAPLESPPGATAFFQDGQALRSRSVSNVVLFGTLDIPEPEARLCADWEREITQHLALEPGDVETLPLARARMRWPSYGQCVQAATHWTQTLGLQGVLAGSEVALMACRGARYHHDGAQYGGAAFCNLFLSDGLGQDQTQDLHFPLIGLRIPLRRGTVVVFDTGQPHAVIARQGSGFLEADFAPEKRCSQVFLTWELPMATPAVAQALGVAFDTARAAASRLKEAQVWHHGAPGEVCPHSGRWLAARYPLD
jgi:hypothetical protein